MAINLQPHHGTPGPHFHFDFGDPSVNMAPTPSFFRCYSKLEGSAVAMNLLRSAELIIVRTVSGWLENYGLAASRPNLSIHDGSLSDLFLVKVVIAAV